MSILPLDIIINMQPCCGTLRKNAPALVYVLGWIQLRVNKSENSLHVLKENFTTNQCRQQDDCLSNHSVTFGVLFTGIFGGKPVILARSYLLAEQPDQTFPRPQTQDLWLPLLVWCDSYKQFSQLLLHCHNRFQEQAL